MPVSVCEPVTLALRESLSASEEHQNLDRQLVTSAKRVLRTHIEYEEVDCYKASVLDSLKCKYVVLNSNIKPTVERIPSAASGSSNDVLLPTPKRVLFSQDSVQLGWSSDRKWTVGSGMQNIGNTCYLNSILQALYHVPSLANWFVSDTQHRERCQELGNQGGCIICSISKTLLSSQSSTGPIKPWLVFSKLRQVCRHLLPGRQEDAHEFLRYLVEAMEKSYLARFKNGKELEQYSKETTPLNQILGGYLRSAVRCLTCGHVSTTFQHFEDLLLDIRKASTLDECLEGFFARERLEDMGYRCEACKKKVSATKQFSLERSPSVLCIALKRFTINGNKINKHITFSSRLDLSRFASKPTSEPLQYRLVAMVTHIGTGQNYGHYTAIGQAEGGVYYQFDDAYVRSISLQSVLSTNAYIMFYELERNPKKLWHPITNIKSHTPSENNRPRLISETCKSSPSHTVSLSKQTTANSQSPLSETNKIVSSPLSVKPNTSSNQSPKKSENAAFIGPLLPTSHNNMTNGVLKFVSPKKNDFTVSPEKNVTASKLVLPASNQNRDKSTKTVVLGASMPELPDQVQHSSKKQIDSNIILNNHVKTVLNGNSYKEKHLQVISDNKKTVDNVKPEVVMKKVNGTISNGQNGNGANNTSLQRLVEYGSEDSSSDSEAELPGKISENGTEEIKTKATVQGWKVSKAITPDDHNPSLQGETGWTCSTKKKLKNGDDKVDEQETQLSTQNGGGGVNTHALVKLSHHGFSVQNWSGGRSQIEKEVGDERREQRKRTHEGTDEMDRGRTKKMKTFSDRGRDNPGYNPFQEYQNNRRFNNSNNGRSYFHNNNRHNNGNHQRNGGGYRSRHSNRGSYHHSARSHHQRDNGYRR